MTVYLPATPHIQDESTRQNFEWIEANWGGGGSGGGGGTVYDSDQVGVIKAWSGTTIPTNWMLCDGSAISRTTYSALFAAVGTTWGAGDGTTTFNIPNLLGRMIVSPGGSLGAALAATGGEVNHTLSNAEMPTHGHGNATGGGTTGGGTTGTESVGHAHALGGQNVPGASSGWSLTPATLTTGGYKVSVNNGTSTNLTVTDGENANHNHGIPGLSVPGLSINNDGGGGPHNNMPPWCAVALIIKVTGASIDPGGALVGPPGPTGPAGPTGPPGPASTSDNGIRIYGPTAATPLAANAWTLIPLTGAQNVVGTSSFTLLTTGPYAGCLQCNTAGVYDLGGAVQFDPSKHSGQVGVWVTEMQVTDTWDLKTTAVPTGAPTPLIVAGEAFLNVGDVIGLQAWSDTATQTSAAANTEWVSAVRIGTGPTGATGPAGSAGPPGTQWFQYTGTGTPTGLTGMNTGDLCVRTNDGEVFEWSGTAWVDQNYRLGPSATMTARMYRNAALTLAATSVSKIPLDTVSYDTSGLASTANGRINITAAGYYQVNGEINVYGSGAPGCYVTIYKNGAEVTRGSYNPPTGPQVDATVADIVQCNAGDYLELWAYNSGAAIGLGTGSVVNYLSVALLTPLSGTVAPVTGARAYRNGAFTPTNAAWSKVNLDTITTDPGNNFQIANGRYICPATGWYAVFGQFSFTTQPATNQLLLVSVWKNGSEDIRGQQLNTQGNAVNGRSQTCAGLTYCNAGDYLELYCYVNGGTLPMEAGPAENFLSVVQVGNSMNFTAAGGDLQGTYPNPTVNGLHGTTGTTSPAAGGAGALPATPVGYVTMAINGVNRQVAYY